MNSPYERPQLTRHVPRCACRRHKHLALSPAFLDRPLNFPRSLLGMPTQRTPSTAHRPHVEQASLRHWGTFMLGALRRLPSDHNSRYETHKNEWALTHNSVAMPRIGKNSTAPTQGSHVPCTGLVSRRPRHVDHKPGYVSHPSQKKSSQGTSAPKQAPPTHMRRAPGPLRPGRLSLASPQPSDSPQYLPANQYALSRPSLEVH